MITVAELSERIEQLEKRVRFLESQISGNSLSQKMLNDDLNQFNLAESNIEENVDLFENSYFCDIDTSFFQNDLPENSPDDFTFCEVFGGIEVSSYNGFADNDTIVVPETFYNQPVVSIGEGAFEGVPVKTIYLPDSIKTIKADAFKNCKRLKSIQLQGGINEIDIAAFSGCESLNKVDLPKSIKKLGRACFSHSAIEQIILPPDLKTIPLSCFYGCKKLHNVLIPEGIVNIESLAFHETCLKKVVIPASVKTIGEKAFDSMNDLELDIVFLGTETIVESSIKDWWNGGLSQPTVYCKAGSDIQKIARKCGCMVKPLSEFQQ